MTNTDDTVVVVALVEEEPEERTQAWRVLKWKDVGGDTYAWDEQGQMTGTGKYGYEPSAQEIGDAHGPGDYLLFQHGSSYPFVRVVTVEAETVYRFRKDDES